MSPCPFTDPHSVSATCANLAAKVTELCERVAALEAQGLGEMSCLDPDGFEVTD